MNKLWIVVKDGFYDSYVFMYHGSIKPTTEELQKHLHVYIVTQLDRLCQIFYNFLLKKMINHLWIIMDWNRRWAKKRGLPGLMWHKSGAENVRKIVKLADEKWIKFITLWALSTDNLKKRNEKEVKWIIKLINNIENYLSEMIENGLKLDVIWNIKELPQESQNVLNGVINKTKDNTGIVVTIALIYWWQDEIVRATKKIIKSWINPDLLTKQEFRKYLDTAKLPIVDIIVRTWWDIRHSGFMLYDSEYSEYYFTDKKWPEFDEDELNKVINIFNDRNRTFGG